VPGGGGDRGRKGKESREAGWELAWRLLFACAFLPTWWTVGGAVVQRGAADAPRARWWTVGGAVVPGALGWDRAQRGAVYGTASGTSSANVRR
jgi:hypothetical protein